MFNWLFPFEFILTCFQSHRLRRPKLKGCEAEVAVLLDLRWKALAFEWTMERSIPSRPSTTPRSLADDRRV